MLSNLKQIVLFFLIAFYFFSLNTYASEIVIERKTEGPECTSGYLSIKGKIIAYTLERADFFNEKNSSRIPLGTYNAFMKTDGELGWRIELVNVPGRKNVQIHVGNFPWQTTGCTLIGQKINGCTVVDSKLALRKLNDELVKINNDFDLSKNKNVLYPITVIYK